MLKKARKRSSKRVSKKSKLKSYFQHWSFFKTFSSIRKRPVFFIGMFVFDILFVFLMLYVFKFFNSLIPQSPLGLNYLVMYYHPLTIFLIFIGLYILVPLLLYSFFKFIILYFVTRIYEKKQFSFRRFHKFIGLNALLFVFAILFVVILMILLTGIKDNFILAFSLVFAILVLIFPYSLFNIAHSLFIRGFPALKSLGRGLTITFGLIQDFIFIFVVDLVLVGIYTAVFYLIGRLYAGIFIRDYLSSLTFTSLYQDVFTIVTSIFFLLVLAYNKVYFYDLSERWLKKRI